MFTKNNYNLNYYLFLTILFILFYLIIIYFYQKLYNENFKNKDDLYDNIEEKSKSILSENKKSEKSENEKSSINSFVILMPDKERIKNVELNKKKLGNIPLNIYNAVQGKNININNLKKKEGNRDNLFIRDFKRRKNQLGCYLSHRNIIYKIKTDKNFRDNYEYTIIFEDDLKIDCINLENEVIKILDLLESKQIYDFDIIFLGNLNNNHGKPIGNNVYELDLNNRLWGTQGYLIKNYNVDKIYNKILKMNMPIDNKYELLLKRKELNGYVIYPYLVSQKGMSSLIN